MRGFISTACGRSSRPTKSAAHTANCSRKSRGILPCACRTRTWCASPQAKIAPARMQRIARDELRVTSEPFSVHDFLKPGIEEMCQLLPPFLARPILRRAARKGWLGRVYFGMEINSTSVRGYLRFLLLAKLRAPPPLRLSLQAGAGADRKLACADPRGRQALAGACARSRRMRAADQRLWRHPCARACQLPHHRRARDPPRACRSDSRRARRPMRSPARAPRRWSIRKARASPSASPISPDRRCASRRNRSLSFRVAAQRIREARPDDRLRLRTRNPETSTVPASGFRVRRLRAVPA